MFKTDNNLYVFVGPTSGGFGNDVTTSAAATNEIHVVHEDGTVSGNLAAGDLFKISQKDADGNVRSTPLLAWNNLVKATGEATDATTTEQNSVWGWNGTAGSIDNLNSNRYTVRVNFKNNVDLYSEQSDLHFFEYVSDANATQLEVADRIQQAMCANEKFSGKASGKNRASAKVSLLSAAVVTEDVASSSGTAAFVNGSKSVTIGNTPAFVAGDYITAAADDATPRYKVVDVTGNVATLSTPYAEATETVADGTAKYIAAATMAAAAAGLKVTGLAQEWKLGLIPYNQVTFEVTLDGWGDTTAIATTAAVTAAGQGHKVAELEWFSQGSAGAPYRHGAVPSNADNITLVADKDDFYDVLEMQFDLADPKHAVAGSGAGKVSVVIALPDGVASADGTQANATFGVSSIFHE